MRYKVIKFYATWFPACYHVDQVLNSIESKPDITNVDIEEQEEYASGFNIRGLPTLIKFDINDQEISRKVGLVSKEELETWLNNES
jgi:thioredoxin 1